MRAWAGNWPNGWFDLDLEEGTASEPVTIILLVSQLLTSPSDGALASWLRTLPIVLVASAVTVVTLIGLAAESQFAGFDLAHVYVPAAERVLDGEQLFPELSSSVFERHQGYVYPPLVAMLAIPLTVFSTATVEIIGVVASLAIMFLSLWIVGLRDARVFAMFALWPATLSAWQNANTTVLVMLATALVWRFRDSWPKSGVALGLGTAFKLLLWPLAVWLAATGRIRAVAAAVIVALSALLVPWAIVGFEGFTGYPALLDKLTEVEGANAHNVAIYSDLLALGLPSSVGHAAGLLAGAALLVGSVVLARKGDDAAAFTLALVAVLALTPIVWLHYLTFLAIPLAIYRPQLSAAWALPWLLWVIVIPGWPFEPRKVVAFAVAVLLVALLLRTPPASRVARPGSVSRSRRVVPEPGS
jgi:alpha-1,2-mannosyltransferase